MKNRITKTITNLQANKQKALVSFMMAGDNDIESCLRYFTQAIAGGADIIEIGMPFSDPSADGISVEKASKRALASGVDIYDIFKIVQQIRKTDNKTPIILMGYYNTVYKMGEKTFVDRAKKAGVDGLIIVDLPFEMAASLSECLQTEDMSLIPLIAPTTSAERMQIILKNCTGFIYAISVKGTTGSAKPNSNDVAQQIEKIRNASNLPIMLGFGIRNGEQAKDLCQYVDGVVAGSVYCDYIEKNTDTADQKIYDKCQEFKTSINNI